MERTRKVNKSRLERDIAIGKLMLDVEELKRAINVTGEKKFVTMDQYRALFAQFHELTHMVVGMQEQLATHRSLLCRLTDPKPASPAATDYIENPAVKPASGVTVPIEEYRQLQEKCKSLQKFTDAEVKAAMIMYRDEWATTFDALSLSELEGRFTSVLVSKRPVSLLDLLVVRAMIKRSPEVLTLKGLSEWISANKFTIEKYSHEIGFTITTKEPK